MNALRVVVIGAGHMGRFHARKLAELAASGEPVVLTGVADIDGARARGLAEECGTTAAENAAEFLTACDAAVVAVPTAAHFQVVNDFLKAGRDVLVEKPIAASLAESEALIALAQSGERILQVGHLERFNAALLALKARIARPRFIEVHRLGPFPERSTDIDVVRDLMIHDLDLIQHLLGEEPERVEAVGVPVLTERVDIANARLVFASGCIANVTASRVSPKPMRKLRIFQASGYFSLDLHAQAAVVMTCGSVRGGELPEITTERLELSPEDALRLELLSFLESVRNRCAPEVAPEQAMAALRTATRVIAAMPNFHPDSS